MSNDQLPPSDGGNKYHIDTNLVRQVQQRHSKQSADQKSGAVPSSHTVSPARQGFSGVAKAMLGMIGAMFVLLIGIGIGGSGNSAPTTDTEEETYVEVASDAIGKDVVSEVVAPEKIQLPQKDEIHDLPPTSIWTQGGDVTGTCHAVIDGKVIMDGPCGGAGHGDSVFVTAAHDGCSIELTRNRTNVSGTIFAYKDVCGDDPDANVNNSDVQLGVFAPEGNCWRSKSAKICLQSGRSPNW